MQRSWWGGVCPRSGRARSPQEGIAARLLQAPGHVQGRALQPRARCISGAELALAPWAILRWRAAGGLSAGGSVKVVLGKVGGLLSPWTPSAFFFLMVLIHGVTGEELPSPIADPCPGTGGL